MCKLVILLPLLFGFLHAQELKGVKNGEKIEIVVKFKDSSEYRCAVNEIIFSSRRRDDFEDEMMKEYFFGNENGYKVNHNLEKIIYCDNDKKTLLFATESSGMDSSWLVFIWRAGVAEKIRYIGYLYAVGRWPIKSIIPAQENKIIALLEGGPNYQREGVVTLVDIVDEKIIHINMENFVIFSSDSFAVLGAIRWIGQHKLGVRIDLYDDVEDWASQKGMENCYASKWVDVNIDNMPVKNKADLKLFERKNGSTINSNVPSPKSNLRRKNKKPRK